MSTEPLATALEAVIAASVPVAVADKVEVEVAASAMNP
jgi:hypothetical protein